MEGTETDTTIVDRFAVDEAGWDRNASGLPRPSEGFVCSVCEALKPGDEIILNDRTRPIEVLGFEEQLSPGIVSGSDYPYHIWWLRGNGTEYRLRWSHLGEYYPTVHTESQLTTMETFSIKEQELTIQTMADGRGERVRWIKPDGVDPSGLSDWVLSRQLEGEIDE